MAVERIYFKKTVSYVIGVRMFWNDWNGVVLTNENPFVGVDEDKLKDFKRANRSLFEKGMLVQIDEPSTDFENENLLTDDEAISLVTSPVAKLRTRLKAIDSEGVVARLLELAQERNRPPTTIKALNERLEQIAEVTPATMLGVE